MERGAVVADQCVVSVEERLRGGNTVLDELVAPIEEVSLAAPER
ncbi:hypothetical protein [Natronomonas sp.]